MALPMAAWRLAYTSGKWLALSGPTSLVIMPPPPAEMSAFATNLWRGTLETRTPEALFEFVHEVGIGSLRDFAAFFWDKAGLHGLFRGAVQLLDVDGELVAEGEDAVTWQEELLDHDQTYTIQLAPIEADQARLPLVVGAALVSSVTLTTAKDQLIRLPDAESMGILEKIPVLGVRRRQRPLPARAAIPGAAKPSPWADTQPAAGPVDDVTLDAKTLPQPLAPQPAAAPSIAAAAAGVPSPEPEVEPHQLAESEPSGPDDQPLQQPVTSLIGDSPAEPTPPADPEQPELSQQSSESEQPDEPEAADAEQVDEPDPESIDEDASSESEQPDEPEAADAEQVDEPEPENIDEDASSESEQPDEPEAADAEQVDEPEPENIDEPEADEAEQVDEPELERPHVPWSPPPLPVSASSVPQSQVSPPGSRQSPVVVPGEFGEIDDETGTVFSTGLAATHKPPVTQAAPDPQVMAVPCRNGHANPRGASNCRLCDEPVDSSNPRLIRRPVLAAVISNQGDGTDLVSGVIVGRAPDSARGPQGSYLMRVSSSGNDISRNHILITPNEWNIVLTDLHSTNGTLVHPPGEPEFELRDGRSVTVEIGTELLLDDQVRLKIVPPRSS